MKKLMILISAAMLGFTAAADCTWSWWVGDDKAQNDCRGCTLAIASERAKVSGAQISLLWSKTKALTAGYVGAIGYSRADTVANGVQDAIVCSADSASLQLGLLCFNKSGFLPFFVFFNFDPAQFGSKAKK